MIKKINFNYTFVCYITYRNFESCQVSVEGHWYHSYERNSRINIKLYKILNWHYIKIVI